MGNRKKMKDNRLRLKKNPSILSRGIARLREEDRGVPTHDEMFGAMGAALRAEAAANGDVMTDEALEGMGLRVDVPEDEAVVIKEVPAKVDGTTVGMAFIHDDGSVAIRLDKDAPQWAVDKINATAEAVGYNLETGEPDGPA